MDFNDADILGYSYDLNFFGEGIYNYRTLKNISIEGTIVDDISLSGVSETIYQRISGLIQSNEFETINIQGVNFGTGRVNSFNFLPSLDINTKKFNASIVCYETGFLSGFPVTINRADLLEGITETFEETLNDQNQKTFNHNISVQYLSGDGVNADTEGKQLASGLRFTNDITSYINNFANSGYKKYVTESINSITNLYSVNESFTYFQESGNYSSDIFHNVVTDDGGITTVTENGLILGIGTGQFSDAKTGSQSEINQSFPRCSGVFNLYDPSNAYAISGNRLFLNLQYNEPEHTVNYSLAYSNNPNLQLESTWEFIQSINESNGIYNVSEQGNIVGHGTPTTVNSGYDAAEVFYNSITGGISNRTNEFYLLNTNDYRPLNLIGQSTSFLQFQGRIEYSRDYSNDSNYIDNPNILKSEVLLTEGYPVPLVNNFQIFNFREIAQNSNVATIGNTSLSINLLGKRTAQRIDYLNYLNEQVNRYIPTNGNDVYILSPNYSFDPRNNEFNFNISWNWHINADLISNF